MTPPGAITQGPSGASGTPPPTYDFYCTTNDNATIIANGLGWVKTPPYSTNLYGDFRPRRGQYGEGPKSVKKNAALLHFLAFSPFDHNFGVLRGEQPPRRGCGIAQRSKPQWGFEPHERASSAGWRPSFWPPSALPRNSGTFFASFFGHKKGRLRIRCHYKRPCRKVGRAAKAHTKFT